MYPDDSIPDETSDDDEILVSKSELKREAAAFQEMAETLIDLPNRFFDDMVMDDELRDAIRVARRLDPRNARKRQVRYIAKLLATTDRTGIESTLASIERQNQQFQQVIEHVDKWCGELIAGDDSLSEELLSRFPALDRQRLRQLTRQAAKSTGTPKAENARSKLFRYLQESVSV
ncbi:MAG: ribosome biogenesis factor YjgA [bacterium]